MGLTLRRNPLFGAHGDTDFPAQRLRLNTRARARASSAQPQTQMDRVKRQVWTEFMGKYGDTMFQADKRFYERSFIDSQAQFGYFEVTRKSLVLDGGAMGKQVPATLKLQGSGTQRVLVSTCSSSDYKAMRSLLIQAHLGCTLNHRNIHQTVAVVTESLPLRIAAQWVSGDLRQYLRNCRHTSDSRPKDFSAAALHSIVLSIAEGCEFLEARGVVHRALQAQRIMVGDAEG